jgi:hypothetical protein
VHSWASVSPHRPGLPTTPASHISRTLPAIPSLSQIEQLQTRDHLLLTRKGFSQVAPITTIPSGHRMGSGCTSRTGWKAPKK